MGLLQPKGPNPHETNVNSPRYTPASQASKRATEMGISGDAATLLLELHGFLKALNIIYQKSKAIF